MKKRWFLLCLVVLAGSLAFGQSYKKVPVSDQKTQIAVMDFTPGDGVDQSTVEGLADMLINALFSTGHYTIIEKSELDKVFREQGISKNHVTEETALRVGKMAGVKTLVLGTVNKTRVSSLREFNIDARIVNVETSELISLASVTKTGGDSFEEMIGQLAKQLDEKIYQPKKVFDETAGKLVLNYRFDYSKMKIGNTLAKSYVTAYENRDMSSPDEAWTVFTNRIEPAFVNEVNGNVLIEKGYILSNKKEGNYEVVIRFEDVDKNDGGHHVSGEVFNRVTRQRVGEIKSVRAKGGKDGIMSDKLVERMESSSEKFGKRLIDLLE